MAKESKNRKKVISQKDLFVAIFAMCAVLLFVIFLVYVNKEQDKQNEQLQQLSLQEETEIPYISIKEQDVCINEICKEGWIELYNKNDLTVDLSGYQVICGNESFIVPEGKKVEKRGFFVVELPVMDNVPVELYGRDGNLCDSVYISALGKQESFARKEDGGMALGYFNLSKGKTNNRSEPISKDFLYFDIQSGFYDQEFQVEIIGPKDWKIYYTLDGSKPDSESEVYKAGISISNRTMEDNKYAALTGLSIRTDRIPWDKVEKCTLIRAIAIDADGNSSSEINASYFVANGNKAMYNNLPVISICAQPEELFGYERGIYPNGKVYEDALASETLVSTSANYYMDYVANVYVKFFGKDKQLAAEGESILQTYNDGFLDFIQKSLLLSSEKGNFILSAGGNDETLKVRDMYMQEVMQDTQSGTIELQPCIVFLEGEYWGVYLLQKAVDEKSLESQYGISADNIVCAVGGKSTDKNKQSMYDEFYQYVVNADLTDESVYRSLEGIMDIQSYLDCYCAHLYIADSSWMSGNDIVWKTITAGGQTPYDDGKWRFIFGHADSGMGSIQLSSPSINTYLRPSIQNDAFLYSLLRNEEFRQRYIETMKKFAEEVFTADNVEERLKILSETYRKGVQASYSRFNGGVTDGAYNGEIDTIKDFFKNRKEYIMKYSQEFVNAEREQIIPLQTDTEVESTEVQDSSNGGVENEQT